MINNSPSLLKQYRNPNAEPTNQIILQANSFIPVVICQFFGLPLSSNQVFAQKQIQCPCEKDQQKYCPLILSWIDTHFERNDWQFKKTYENYSKNKRISKEDRESLKIGIQEKIKILGLNLKETEKQALHQIISNYYCHAKYYNKYQKLVSQSHIHIWVCISIAYHIGFSNLCADDYHKILVFWGMDIAMDAFEDLRPETMQSHFNIQMNWVNYYFPSVSRQLQIMGVDLKKIVRQFFNQMLFGYMGCTFIAYFLAGFMKSKWNYLFQMILRYFESLYKKIQLETTFMSGTMTTDQLYGLLLNEKETEWPLISSDARFFSLSQESGRQN